MADIQVEPGALIEYSDFIARAIDVKKELSKEALEQAFKHFDPNNTGKITPEGLKFVLQKQGKQLSKEELKELINEVDKEEAKTVSSPR